MLFTASKHSTFLIKIQNRISEKTGKKILLLHGIWIRKFKAVVFPSNFWIQNIKVVGFPSNFWIQNFKVVVFPSNFWNTTIIWQFFRVILNFAQECYYLENKVGVVDFTKACGLGKFQSWFGHHFCSNLFGQAPRGPKGVKKWDLFFYK